MTFFNQLILGDCLNILPKIKDKSIDMILCDLPYGITACKWDTIIPFQDMWAELNRITKDYSAMVFTASQPFTSRLVLSNLNNFRHEWIYKKRCASNFAQAKYAPMKEHESVLVFAKNKPFYNPIMEERKGKGEERVKYAFSEKTRHKSGDFVGEMHGDFCEHSNVLRYPSSVQEFNNRATGDRGLHPTQKPVLLMEYLIKTYSQEGDTILDFCMGCGTTGVAAQNTRRSFIGIEIDEEYFKIAQERIENPDLLKGGAE